MLIVAAVFILAVGIYIILTRQRSKPKTGTSRAKTTEASLGLRQMALTMDYTKAGIQEFVGANQIWGVIMEMGFPDATVTLVALVDGTASLYFSSGGGFIGGVGHEAVRKAASKMCHVADAFVPSCSPATEFPFPKQGYTIFYILTKDGKVTATALESDLGEEKHALSSLFYAGQDVITQLRLVSDEGH
jgi:hypothetical protein